MLLSLLGAVGIALLVDRLLAARGLLPPGLRLSKARRWSAGVLLTSLFWLAVTSPLATFGSVPAVESVAPVALFSVHLLLALTLATWLVLSFAGAGRGLGEVLGGQIGLRWPDPREVALGIIAGLVLWVPAMMCSFGVALGGWALGWIELDAAPPPIIPWLVGQSVALRLALALSAGFFEEVFFRGFLQPRVGVTVSTVLFVLAHAGYGQLPLLGGVTLLSIGFAGLVVWRRSLEAAIVAHATFDAVQLLVVMPLVLRELPGVQ